MTHVEIVFCHFWFGRHEACKQQVAIFMTFIYARLLYFVAFSLVPFQTSKQLQSSEQQKIRHQPSDMTIRHWQLTSALICQPPQKNTTHVSNLKQSLPNQHGLQPFRSPLFYPPKSAIWPDQLVYCRSFSFQGFGVGSFELQHHISLDPRLMTGLVSICFLSKRYGDVR